jgi:hypothetical protein
LKAKFTERKYLPEAGPRIRGAVRSSSPLMLREFRERAEYSGDEEVAEKSACLSVRGLSRCA